MWYAVYSWFFHPDYAALAWFGLVFEFGLTLLNLKINQALIHWQGRFYDALQDASEESLPIFWKELKFWLLINAYDIVTSPLYRWFFRWYDLKCVQTMQRAYVARWPKANVPEGAAQRVQEDLFSLQAAWKWAVNTIPSRFGSVYLYYPELVDLTKKFPLPSAVGLPLVASHWAPILAVGAPVLATFVSIIIAMPMKFWNYQIQMVQAQIRKVLVRAEDAKDEKEGTVYLDRDGNPAVEEHFLHLMATNMKLWYREVFLGWWTSIYGMFPEMLIYVVGGPHLFSSAEDKPKLGDLKQLESTFNSVIFSLSLFVTSMETINSFRAALQRLTEYESVAGVSLLTEYPMAAKQQVDIDGFHSPPTPPDSTIKSTTIIPEPTRRLPEQQTKLRPMHGVSFDAWQAKVEQAIRRSPRKSLW